MAARMKFSGKVWRFGDHVNTDDIIPARYLNMSEGARLAEHLMEGIDPGFAGRVAEGDIIVAGSNFGCGSSREHAPLAIKAAGVACVVAESFARIFFRNAVNIGLPILECPDAAREARTGDHLEIDLRQGTVRNRRTGNLHRAQPFPPFMEELMKAGGLIKWVKKQYLQPATNAASAAARKRKG